MKKWLRAVIFIVTVIFTALFTKITIERPFYWKECYSVSVLYSDNRFTKYYTSYKYEEIYIKFSGDIYYIKLIDKSGKEEILEGNRQVHSLVINYK